MIAKRITRVTLTRTSEPTAVDHTTLAGTELWRVEWTISSIGGKAVHLRHAHYTDTAARRHVANLLEQRVDGLSIDDVYSESV